MKLSLQTMRLRNLIFRQHNVIEYKSPGDSLNIDDFYKTLAYAFLYKSLSDKVDGIPADQLTLSLVRQGYPRDIEDLQRREIAMDCEPLKRLMKGELDKAEARGEARGKAIGEARVENIIVSLLKANQKVEFVAKVVKMTKEQVIAIGKKAAVL